METWTIAGVFIFLKDEAGLNAWIITRGYSLATKISPSISSPQLLCLVDDPCETLPTYNNVYWCCRCLGLVKADISLRYHGSFLEMTGFPATSGSLTVDFLVLWLWKYFCWLFFDVLRHRLRSCVVNVLTVASHHICMYSLCFTSLEQRSWERNYE